MNRCHQCDCHVNDGPRNDRVPVYCEECEPRPVGVFEINLPRPSKAPPEALTWGDHATVTLTGEIVCVTDTEYGIDVGGDGAVLVPRAMVRRSEAAPPTAHVAPWRAVAWAFREAVDFEGDSVGLDIAKLEVAHAAFRREAKAELGTEDAPSKAPAVCTMCEVDVATHCARCVAEAEVHANRMGRLDQVEKHIAAAIPRTEGARKEASEVCPECHGDKEHAHLEGCSAVAGVPVITEENAREMFGAGSVLGEGLTEALSPGGALYERPGVLVVNRSTANASQVAAAPVEWPRYSAPVTKDETVRRLCRLLHDAWDKHDPAAHQPNDCFCAHRGTTEMRFQSSGQALAWVEAVVLAALAAPMPGAAK